jgi:thiamine pyrophosphokinase
MLDPAFVTDEHEDQETNDLTKALRWATAHYPTAQIDFFAVTGKREDHTLANLALITEAQRACRIFTEYGRFDVVLAGESALEVLPKTPISFLSFVPQCVTVRGVEWPVERLNLSSLWRATLNRTTASQLIVQCEQPLLIYRPWSNV